MEREVLVTNCGVLRCLGFKEVRRKKSTGVERKKKKEIRGKERHEEKSSSD